MSDDGFFTFLARSGVLGNDVQDLQQRDDIAGLGERIAHNQREQQGTSSTVAQLQHQVTALTRELSAIKAAFEVLSHVLVDSGQVDPAVLDARLAEAQARAETARRATSSVVCRNCGLSFLGAQTVDTATGALCKRCRAVAG